MTVSKAKQQREDTIRDWVYQQYRIIGVLHNGRPIGVKTFKLQLIAKMPPEFRSETGEMCVRRFANLVSRLVLAFFFPCVVFDFS